MPHVYEGILTQVLALQFPSVMQITNILHFILKTSPSILECGRFEKLEGILEVLSKAFKNPLAAVWSCLHP